MRTTLTPPPAPEASWVERRAKLFEAGDYPDKGVVVTRDHLAELAQRFNRPVPVLIEHAESPLQMGYLTAVFCEGDELFGTVSLSPQADALVRSSGANALSLGLAPDLSAIREVSLVRNPRVPSARLFSDGPSFCGSLSDAVQDPALEAEWRRLREVQVDREIEDLMREGRITPAQSEFARSLLLCHDTIEFDGRSTAVRALVLEMLRRQPPRNLFAELTPTATADHSQHLMLPEEAEFYRRHFPDVSLDEIAKRKR